ncbi:glycosyltransferase family 4 protein [Chloroflexus sp.]|uniref:glycosyltransferase family 4 protein n=1 Tax=Chloroflexus sp. TaxID=1904827 RepID=UPI00260AED9C|nr:glycosyltransferase family 1 protein [uncultured Chloroflexus sp.]
MIRFAIDARLNAYRQGGIAHYTRSLARAMASLLNADEELLLLEHRRSQTPLVPGVRRSRLLTPPHHRYEQFSLPVEVLFRHPSLLHSPDFIPPFLRSYPAVITIHDLAFLHFPEILDREARRYYGQIHQAVVSADAIIAVSQATRDDIVERLDVPPERITVIYEAADEHFRPLELSPGSTRVIDGQTLTAGTFLLFVSTIEPRKNIPTLLRALRICCDRRPAAGYRLVLAGARGWLDEPILALIGELGLNEHVIRIGFVGGEDLRWLYAACRIYLNPSRYEGFGLPALEALACGAPAIVADTSSLPEVVGDAAWLAPPLDLVAWADLIEQLWHDETAQADLRRRGPQQAARFSWQTAAAQTLAVYRRLVRRV